MQSHMFAAYLYQSVNLLTGLLMVPLLLLNLDPSQFVMWAIFTTLGGMTLQVESSIQVVSVRRIAHAFHAGKLQALTVRHAYARRLYRMLAAFTLVAVASAGATYLMQTASENLETEWKLAWSIFMIAYAVNYWFGANTATLLALGKIASYNYIAALTRALNLITTFTLLMLGWGVVGICTSFLFSVVLSCLLIKAAARKTLADTQRRSDMATGTATVPPRQSHDIIRYTLFMLAAYIIYKGGVLVAVWYFPKDEVGAYSLMLQALTILFAFALVPIQVWLPRLMKAIVINDLVAVMRELSRSLLLANVTFMIGSLLLGMFGPSSLEFIGSRISLPPTFELVITSLAFTIELNLFLLINLLVSRQQFEFVRIYIGCVCLALVCAAFAVWLEQPLVLAFVLAPALVQGLICLPLILLLLCKQLDLAPRSFLPSLLRGLKRY